MSDHAIMSGYTLKAVVKMLKAFNSHPVKGARGNIQKLKNWSTNNVR